MKTPSPTVGLLSSRRLQTWALLSIAALPLATACGDEEELFEPPSGPPGAMIDADAGMRAGSGGTGAASTGGAGAGVGGTGFAGTGGAGPGANLSIEEYCQKRDALELPWCEYADQCCTAADKADLMFVLPACTFGPSDPTECTTFVHDRVADGSLAFDGTWGEACIAELAQGIPFPPSTCDGVPGTEIILYGHANPSFHHIPECRKTWRGLLTEGAVCEYEAQCAEGLSCQGALGSDFTCQPVRRFGEACELNSDCEDAYLCNARSSRCDSLGSSGSECLFDEECEDGLLCASFTCTAPRAAFSSCADMVGACAPGTVCDFSTDTCLRLEPDGYTCSFSSECQGRCDTTLGQCVAICGGTNY